MSISRLQRLLQMYRKDPEDAFLLFALAKEYEKQRSLDEALEYYFKLEQLDEQYVGLYYHLGKLLEQKERWQEALNYYDKGIAIAARAGEEHARRELEGAREMLRLMIDEG